MRSFNGSARASTRLGCDPNPRHRLLTIPSLRMHRPQQFAISIFLNMHGAMVWRNRLIYSSSPSAYLHQSRNLGLFRILLFQERC